MPKLDQATIDNIRQNSDIVNVIGNYLALVQKGKSIKCVCPFHDDHNPSMSISPTKQIYKCFSCGAAGNVFTFVQNFEQVTYFEAVKRVAEISHLPFNFEVVRDRQTVNPQTKKYYNLMKEASDYAAYQLFLPENKEYLDYLYSRSISDELIKKFKIGFLPKGEKLSQFLLAKGYDIETMLNLNLITKVEDYNYNVFSNRLTFPISDEWGNIVGFSARSLLADQAKYINSATTPIYQKSQLVYNYQQARPFCQKQKQVIVCEGIMDVIAFAKVGIYNVVATLGTACTMEQLKKIRQLSPNICICYDGDKAGQAATYKLGKLAATANIPLAILDNETDLDPDDIIKEYSENELKLLTTRQLTWIEFLFKYLSKQFDLRNFSQRDRFAKEMLAEISKLPDENHRRYFLKELNSRTNFDFQLQQTKLAVETEVAKKPVAYKASQRAQMEIINQMLLSKEAIAIFQDDLGSLPDEDLYFLALLIIKADNENLKVDAAMLYDWISQEYLRQLLGEIETLDLLQKEYNEDVLYEAIDTVRRLLVRQQIKALDQKIKATHDIKLKSNLEQEKIALKEKELSYLTPRRKDHERTDDAGPDKNESEEAV